MGSARSIFVPLCCVACAAPSADPAAPPTVETPPREQPRATLSPSPSSTQGTVGLVAGPPLDSGSARLRAGEYRLVDAPPSGGYVVLGDAADAGQQLLDVATGQTLAVDGSVLRVTDAAVYFLDGNRAVAALRPDHPDDAPLVVSRDPLEGIAVSDDGTWFASWGNGELTYGMLGGASASIDGATSAAFPSSSDLLLVGLDGPNRLVSVQRGASLSSAATICGQCRLEAVSGDGQWIATSQVDATGVRSVQARPTGGRGPSLDVALDYTEILRAWFDEGSQRLVVFQGDGDGGDAVTAYDLPGANAPVLECGHLDGAAILLTRDSVGCATQNQGIATATIGDLVLSPLVFLDLQWDGSLLAETGVDVVTADGVETAPPYTLSLRNTRGAIVRWPIGDTLDQWAPPTAWTDPDHLLYLDGNTLVLVDASGDPWTTRVVAYGVSEFLWRQPSRRLLYTVRGVSPSVDGLYLVSL